MVSKAPPCKILDPFLEQDMNISGLRRLQTDLGSELAKSNDILNLTANMTMSSKLQQPKHPFKIPLLSSYIIHWTA